jgi:hypothetical protein
MRKQRTYFGGLWLSIVKIILMIVVPFIALVLIFAMPSFVKRWQLRDVRPRALNETMQQGEIVIVAINKYAAEHAKPPADLKTLLPRYLSKLPEAGPMAEDGWHYAVSEDAITGGWKLRVKVPDEMSDNSWFSFGDVFVYHPSEKYERNDYGGVLKRVGKWGYYYE